MSTKAKSKTILEAEWVVAAGQPAERVVWLRGKDYPHLCEKCRSAIDQAAQILPEWEPWGPMYDPEDIEVPFMFAYDHAWLCGGHECDCVREPEVEIVSAMTVQSTTYGPGRGRRALGHFAPLRQRL